MEHVNEWNRRQLLQSPMFAPLHPWLGKLTDGRFPKLDELNDLLADRVTPITVSNGKPLQFVAQAHGRLPFEAQYEPRCYLEGEVQTRSGNWHDLFNALVWLAFPAAKRVINARHYRALTGDADSMVSQRGSRRDMLTLFDESGVIVAYADDELAGLLREFRWKDLFWYQRERMNTAMDFYLFGHGLYEKAMQPYIGMTGQGLLLAVERAFFGWPQSRQMEHLDGLLADYLNAPQHCHSTCELNPVPLLGVPGWSAENSDLHYYDNADYFRAGRKLKLPADKPIS